MTYCTLDEAQSLIPLVTIATGTVPTLSDATEIVEAISAEVDMHLRARGYALPVTDTEARASLKTVCRYGVAASVLRAAVLGGSGDDDGGAAFWERKYQAALALVDAGGIGPDADTTGGNAVAHGFQTAAERAAAQEDAF